jgi:Zn-dependent protease with chaperone function
VVGVTLPDQVHRYPEISPRAFQHPADRAATAALKQIPYLDEVIRKLIELGYERAVRQAYFGAGVRLGEEQLPQIWALQREVYNVLDIAEVPDLYLTQYPIANASVIGAGKPMVVVYSELIRLLDTDGRRVVLAHEAAHVLSDHVLYQTALVILMRLTSAARLPLLAGLPLLAMKTALLEWSRAAELSCDRAAALVTRNPMAVCRTLMTLAAGAAAEDLNLDAFMKQGMDYKKKGGGLERLTRLLMQLNLTHPMPVRRTHELLSWVREGEYDRIVGGAYMRRGEEYGAAQEAATASIHYGERIRDSFRDAGESIADVGQQLGEWLSKQRGSKDEPDDDEDEETRSS